MDTANENIEKPKKTFSINKLKGDRVIWLIVLFFAMISIAMVYTSTTSLAHRSNVMSSEFLWDQIKSYILGFLVLFICYRIPLGVYRNTAYILLAITAVLLILPKLGSHIRSFTLFGQSIHPGEIAKITTIIYLARIMETSDFKKFKDYALKIMLPVGAICILCLLGSISATIIICFTALMILIACHINWKWIGYTILIGIGALSILIVVNNYTNTFERFNTFLPRLERQFGINDKDMTPEELKEAHDKDFQAKEAIEAIQLGKITGRKPGNSLKRDSLPNAYDDYIYSIIVEEWGLIGGIFVIFLYIWLFNRCIVIARMCNRKFSAIVVLGLALLIVTQAFVHILVNIGIFPVTGQTLPMISKGKSSLIAMSAAIGIILSVNRTIVIKENKRKEQEELEAKEKNNNEIAESSPVENK